jgi:lipopolysaccharide/colanic/teichoic acid biosynthesis glycosyltransferase
LQNPKLEQFFAEDDSRVFISPGRVNDLRHINRHFDEVNKQLETGDYYFGYFETFTAKRNRMLINKVPVIRTVYFSFDFLIHRVMPKLKVFSDIYFLFSKGRNRLLSKAETLGRLVANGFEISRVESIDGLCYFKVQKVRENTVKRTSSDGLIFKMKRVGKNGKLFNVYKLRTMHPYSEYIQDYVMQQQGFAPSGKFDADFRITPWGRWMRKYWIDEIPQIFNVLKGDMRLVGVRPVSESYFKILPEDIRKSRIKFKPGCIPPYVSLNYKSSVEDVLSSERKYLEEKEAKPFLTDFKFLFYALINIFLKGKRSS